MAPWQRRARLIIAVTAVVFAIVVASEFKRRVPATNASPVPSTDPKAIVDSANGFTFRLNREHEEIRIGYEKASTYADGSTKLIGVTVVTERAGGRTFTITAKEGQVGQNEADVTLAGDVQVTATDGMVVQAENATYTGNDGIVRTPGPVEFSRGRMSGSGVGLTYNKNSDVLTILDQASLHMTSDEQGHDRLDITSGSAELNRNDKIVRFERTMKAVREVETIDADSAIAHLSADEQDLEFLELRGNSRITGSRSGAGALRALTGRDIDLKYAAGARTIEHAAIRENAVIELSGTRGQSGRRIVANTIDVSLAKDGSTPTAITARDSVQLTVPAEQDEPARTINAQAMDAKGDERNGLTSAHFTGNVEFRERGADVSRVARSAVLDVTLAAGLNTIDDAKFPRGVRFEEGTLVATAAAARYLPDKGTLDLGGSEPGFLVPHMQDDRITIDASHIDLTLAGPKVNASGGVKSVLLPKTKQGSAGAGKPDPKVPSMLKQDEPVIVTANDLNYDGDASHATYRGNVQLRQKETTIKASSFLSIDDKSGDLTAGGGVTTTGTLVQENKDKKKERVSSNGAAKDFRYEESLRRATYLGDAHLVGPQGDMTASKIELYLKESGDEVDRAEGHGSVKLTDDKRRATTGDEMKYFGAEERYELTGTPVTLVDHCGNKTQGLALTFFKTTDTIIVHSDGQTRTQTSGGGASCP